MGMDIEEGRGRGNGEMSVWRKSCLANDAYAVAWWCFLFFLF